jgi:hypothetical protein
MFLSKNLTDEYINMMAAAAGAQAIDTNEFVYDHGHEPIVLRGILKHKIMKQCWQDARDFYYVDTGYFDHWLGQHSGRRQKIYHRIVKNNLQHGDIVSRPSDRWQKLGIALPRRRHGSRIIVALPDEKPCRFYGIDSDQWLRSVCDTLAQHTDRDVVIRQRAPVREQRTVQDPLSRVLTQDIHALITFNSVAAIESILSGVPAFVLAPCHAARPVANVDLAEIETPHWPDQDKLHAWACHLAYGQFHVGELRNGRALEITNEY